MDESKKDGHHCNDETCRGYFDQVYQRINTRIGWAVFSVFAIIIIGMLGSSFGFTYDVAKDARAADSELNEKISELNEKVSKLADRDDLEQWKDDIAEIIKEMKE
jgi:hypothetical protein